MQTINQYAQAPQTGEGYYRNNNLVEPGIIKFLEDESDLRQFFVPKKMQGVLSKTYIAKHFSVFFLLTKNTSPKLP